MDVKSQFSADEWTTVARAPFYVSAAIGFADIGGPFAAMKEGMALARSVQRATDGTDGELAKLVAGEIRDHRPNREELTGGNRTADAAQDHAAARLGEIAELVRAKAPDEADRFTAWLSELAEGVAEAGKEGGFLGFGGEKVSQSERNALAEINQMLGR